MVITSGLPPSPAFIGHEDNKKRNPTAQVAGLVCWHFGPGNVSHTNVGLGILLDGQP